MTRSNQLESGILVSNTTLMVLELAYLRHEKKLKQTKELTTMKDSSMCVKIHSSFSSLTKS